MQPGRGVIWVLGGRAEVNTAKLKKFLRDNSLHFVTWQLCCSTKQLQQCGLFKRQRSLANSRSHEQLYMCRRGKQPKNLPKFREYVDLSH